MRLIRLAMALQLCGGGCGASQRGPDASRSDIAGDAAAPQPDASAVTVPADAGDDTQVDRDAARADAGTSFDAGAAVFDAGLPADASSACPDAACSSRQACDADHPCTTPDTLCNAGACVPDPDAPPGAWPRSAWSGRVGLVRDDDATLWCTLAPTAARPDAPAELGAQLQLVALDGSQRDTGGDSEVAQRLRVQCFATAALTGASSLLTSAWSRDAEHDEVQLTCPRERPYAGFARCQLAAGGKPPWVYAGPSCGDGQVGLTGKPSVRGQLLGDHYELAMPGRPLFNQTGSLGVVGTDLGFQFLAQGRMYLGFGDTWENDAQLLGPNGYRGSVLASTQDFEPADDNGLVLEAWETAPERPGIAREVIASPHDQSGGSELTAIAAAGFGLSEGAARYRFLWFAGIKGWSPFATNESTLAWSENGGPFVRGDQAPAFHPPRWPFDSYFGPGATWVDRQHGYIYLLGVRTYRAGYPVRLARVRATLAAVRDHLQYEYWTGTSWRRPDPNDEYALARLSDAVADLIPGSADQNTRPELSVSYNPYVDRFTLLVHNDATPFNNEPATYLQIWQAPSIEGPWSLVDTGDALVLPPNLYGPYHSEQTFSAEGRDVHFLLTEWNLLPLALGQPYVVGLWSMQLTRRVRAGCML